MTEQRHRRWLLQWFAVAYFAVVGTAVREAVNAYGTPMAGVFLDPNGAVSNLGFRSWDWQRAGLQFPDAVIEVEGQRLRASADAPPVRVWDRAVLHAAHARRPFVTAVVRTGSGERSVQFRVRKLEPVAWWTFAACPLFGGALYACAGFIALWAGATSALARTFGRVGLSTGMFLTCLFDFHTSRTLTPLFLVAFATTPMSWIALALRLPDDAPMLRRLPWLEAVTTGIGLLIAAAFIILHRAGITTLPVRVVWTAVFGCSFLVFASVFLVRFLRARGIRRDRMRALLVSAVPSYATLIVFHSALPASLETNAATYAALAFFPIATGYAFIRFNLWGSRALLSRLLTRLLVGAIACAVAIGLGTAFAVQFGVPFQSAVFTVAIGAVTAPFAVYAALLMLDHLVFKARARYKPTVEQLSTELIAISSPDEVARAVERTIRRWLTCARVEMVLSPQATLPGAAATDFSEPEQRSSGLTEVSQLSLPVEFAGVALGTLHVGEKPGHALFTRDDVDLLQTIVNQGALALAHAYAYQELEVRRREQAAAWRGERAALVETLAAEIAHEIRYPINFFRSLFAEGVETRALDREDVDIGREEVDRLERLVSGLRRMMPSHSVERRPVQVTELCNRVETLLRDTLGERRLERSVPSDAQIICDPDQVMQILVNLVANAVEAAGDGSVGVAWVYEKDVAELLVWDTGPGFGDDGSQLFVPGYTTRPRGTGLGLAITQRLVRAHGWSIAALRRNKSTQFVISIPRRDVVSSFDDAQSAGAA